ncbi:lipopolysaccharide biosynthesis protein [Pseudarthrobacter sp. NBSH8]|uniref:lipopolysaccharide biosynthesis protein n=1 Tax=Pseudarthrobacter sp. NBSH8 TaxID=2596911 RepID=UPI001624544E|nr:lipopolysaccharide biosynthesis protein [Pseudarthrobacter sp. NBSH8]QNE16224.1 lipopolysaccharide biosynthesis protein [Pseudarthrobacter sp. NBSH8]
MSLAPGDLTRAGVRGAVWQGLAFISGRVIVLITTIILARLLSPEEYGLVALALVLMAYAETIADAGVAQALVYLPRTGVMARSALLISVLLGGALATAIVLAGPWIASLFNLPGVGPLVQVLGISVLATSFGAVPEALLRRDLKFKPLTLAPVVRAATMGTVTLVLAFAGNGAWSLAVGTAAGSVAYAVTCWFLVRKNAPWQIWRVGRDALRANIAYGAPVAGSSLLARLIFDVDYLIIGLLLGAQALGYYTLAFRLPEALILNVFFVLSTVLFPLYAQVRGDPDRLRGGYLKSVQIQTLYGVTAGVGLAVLAPVLVPLLFGQKWTEAVLPLVFLALYAAVRSLGAGANDVYKALGRPGLSIGISVARLVILVPVLFVAAQWGIVGVACAQLAVAFVFACGMQAVAARVIKIRASRLAGAVVPGVVCGAAVGVAGLGTLGLPFLGPIMTTAVVVVMAIGLVYAILRLGFPALLRELLKLARRA